MKCRYLLLCVPFIFSVGCRELSAVNTESSYVETVTAAESPAVPTTVQAVTENPVQNTQPPSILNSTGDIGLYDTDGAGENYIFTYGGESFRAVYSYDNWKIIDSYKIENQDDMRIICQALKDIHPIHSADMSGYRDADDMAYEWFQHNIAYNILPSDSQWKINAKDVDINPNDQNKSLYDMFLERQDMFNAD